MLSSLFDILRECVILSGKKFELKIELLNIGKCQK